MLRRISRLATLTVLGLLSLADSSALLAADKPEKGKTPALDPAGVQFFEKHIRPVLVGKCYQCHAADSKEIKGGLVLDTRDGLLKGGDSGPAVVPKNIDDSILIEALKHEGLEMPPNEKLSDDVIAKFEQWVRMGAPDPRDGKAVVAKREIDFVKAREHWSFQAIKQPQVPAVDLAAWPRTDIDRFILAKLEAKQLKPVADADPTTLARRMYFDLIGLPPSPGDIDRFLSEYETNAAKAVTDLADRLLTLPQFGERWGRHWLDVVRYAESTGMERNYTYPYAWRYRDYVIDAMNRDKPFDQFVREQVAGDLLDAKLPDERRDQLVATAFLAMGPKSLNERNREQFTMDIVDEQVDATFRVFMGLTAGCARCHDHKFDPIPSKEYYALAGIFRSTDVFYGTGNANGNRQPGKLLAWSPSAELQAVNVLVADNKKGKATSTTDGDSPAKIKERLAEAESQLEKAKNRAKQGDDKKRQRAAKLIEELEATVKKLQQQLQAAQKEKGQRSVATVDKNSLIMAVLDGKKPSDTELRLRGEPEEKGDAVPRGFLTIGTVGHQPKVGQGSGRRELAEYLTQDDNPLTARVAANRVWQHLLGRGIVATVDSFGVQGDAPTHPELLDWLAVELKTHGWSLKHLIRTIVASRVYQLAATGNAQAEKLDPAGDLLWRARHRRLEVEALRDAMLVASGQLDLSPETGSIVSTIGDGEIGRNLAANRLTQPSLKRGVYLPIVRLGLPEMLQVFDFPEPSNISGQREVTTVATQALYLMNNEFVLEQAGHFARRLLDQKSLGDQARVDLAYRLALGRHPSASERDDAIKFINQTKQALAAGDKNTKLDAQHRSWTALCQALFASAEFRYVE